MILLNFLSASLMEVVKQHLIDHAPEVQAAVMAEVESLVGQAVNLVAGHLTASTETKTGE